MSVPLCSRVAQRAKLYDFFPDDSQLTTAWIENRGVSKQAGVAVCGIDILPFLFRLVCQQGNVSTLHVCFSILPFVYLRLYPVFVVRKQEMNLWKKTQAKRFRAMARWSALCCPHLISYHHQNCKRFGCDLSHRTEIECQNWSWPLSKPQQCLDTSKFNVISVFGANVQRRVIIPFWKISSSNLIKIRPVSPNKVRCPVVYFCAELLFAKDFAVVTPFVHLHGSTCDVHLDT